MYSKVSNVLITCDSIGRGQPPNNYQALCLSLVWLNPVKNTLVYVFLQHLFSNIYTWYRSHMFIRPIISKFKAFCYLPFLQVILTICVCMFCQ